MWLESKDKHSYNQTTILQNKGNPHKKVFFVIDTKVLLFLLGTGFHAEDTKLIKDEITSQQEHRYFDVEEKAKDEVRKRTKSAKISKTAEPTAQTTDKTKLVASDAASEITSWTQNQQTIFEWALKQYPKGTDKRWDKVSEHIPGKTKVRTFLFCFFLFYL